MSRKDKLVLNTLLPIINKFVVFLCGLILPRLFISTYGSDVNGLIASINSFLGMIALMDLGMGAVVESSLYKPLADRNETEISRIIISSKRFFKRIALIFAVYICVLVVIYPTLIRTDFGWLYEASLIVILAVDSFAAYFFAITYTILLKSDQKAYIPVALNCIGTILNFVCCVILIKAGASVHIVKLVSAAVLLFRPLYLNLYVKKHYNLLRNVDITEEPIKQKWNGVAQHLAYYVTDRTDVIVLTFFSTLSNVSVYTVYNMVVAGIRDVIIISQTGIQALVGNMLANNEREKLLKTFNMYEWIVHNVSTVLFTCTAILIIPFMEIYTKNITDADYNRPVFAAILIAAVYMYCLRFPYHITVLAAGHFRQTQTSSIIEMMLNIVITIALVFRYDLTGVATGTFVSLTYRTIYLVHYNHNIIEEYRAAAFYKLLLANALIIAVSMAVSRAISFKAADFFSWALYAAVILIMVTAVCILTNLVFRRDNLKTVFTYIFEKRRG